MNDEPIFSVLMGKDSVTLARRTTTPTLNDGVFTFNYSIDENPSTLPVGTTQLRISIISITAGAPALTGTPTFTLTINPSNTATGSTTYSEDSNSNVYLLGMVIYTSNFSTLSHVYAGHRDFSSTGTIQLEALDSSNNVLAIGTYTGQLSTNDDD